MKTKENSKNPFPYSVWLSKFNWSESYAELQRMVELSLESAEIRSFAKKQPTLRVVVSDPAEVQMLVYHLIIEDESFRNFWCRNRKPSTLQEDLINVAKNALGRIKEICNELKSNFYPEISYELDEYKKNKKYSARSIHIDKNNRFVYRVIPEGNILQILEVMFHYDDKPLKENVTQQIMLDMFDDLSISEPREDIPNYLFDIFEKLKSKEEEPDKEEKENNEGEEINPEIKKFNEIYLKSPLY